MPNLLRLPLLLPSLFLVPVLYGQGTLTVEVELHRSEAGGVVRVALCDAASFESDEGCILREVEANGPMVNVVFHGVPEGEYAIKAFHDVNANGELDTNWMGIPREPYAFGNDAMGTFGPPGFDQAKVVVGPGRQQVRIRTRG
ncbi:MAG: DUF2141 domain-containing protein [Flavobacteriales bacterium]|nr:DUF2141 domain-containing protein [Flavobacteriales bacterium]